MYALVVLVLSGAVALPSSAPPVALAQAKPAATRQVPVESLIYDLKNPDAVRRREAVTQLGLNKVQRATPDLVPLATDPDPSVRRALVATLIQVGDVRALPGFITLSADAERDVRDKAVEGLTNLYLPQESGLVVTLNRVANFFNPWSDEWADVVVEPDLPVDPAVVDAITARLQDTDGGIRAKAARSLGILRGRTASGALMSALKDDQSDAVRFEAVRALRKIGDRSIAPDLVPLIPINAPKVRNEIVLTVGRLRDATAVPELTRLAEKELGAGRREMDRTFALHLVAALAAIGSPESRPLFVRLQTSTDADLRRLGFEGVARGQADFAAEDVSETARRRLAEKDGTVRMAQDFALYRMGRKEHLQELVRALGSRRTNAQARDYLLDLHPNEVPDLYAYSNSPDANILEALAEILGLVGDATALPTLRELVRDTRGQVSAFAGQAIRRIDARTAANVGR